MTLQELYERIGEHIEAGGDRARIKEVGIVNSGKTGFGGTPMTKIVNVYPGIDWDASKYFLLTEEKMQNSEEKDVPLRDIWDKAKEWAKKQVMGEYDAEEFYRYVFMFIRDQFKIVPKF